MCSATIIRKCKQIKGVPYMCRIPAYARACGRTCTVQGAYNMTIISVMYCIM